MAYAIKRIGYYETIVEGGAREVSRLLSVLAGVGVDLRGYRAVPLGCMRTRFTLFADDAARMERGAKKAGLALDGPHSALYVQGDDDEPGALAGIYEKLSRARLDLCESAGLAGIRGSYGVVLYLKEDDCERAAAALAA
jgi:hypothetical protein